MPAQYDPNVKLLWRKAAYKATAKYFFGTLHLIKHRMSITGRENLPKEPFIAVGNHLSNEDPPLLALATERPVAFIAKQELYEKEPLRSLVLFYGAISVNRERPEASTFKAAKEAFKCGWSLGMFIEGTRSKTPGVLGQPNHGPAYFAKILKAQIVPVGIVGTDKAWGKGYTRFGKPIQPGDDLDAKTWEVMEALSDLTGFQLPPRLVQRSTEVGYQSGVDSDR